MSRILNRILNTLPKGARSPYKQHALKARSPYKQHALKGQKLLAQGSALGYHVRKQHAL